MIRYTTEDALRTVMNDRQLTHGRAPAAPPGHQGLAYRLMSRDRLPDQEPEAACSISWRQMPASSGVQGAGRQHNGVGSARQRVHNADLSLR